MIEVYVAIRFSSVMADALKMAEVDNADDWRRIQLSNLTNLVQRRLDYLQNPADCSKARRLVCQLNKGASFVHECAIVSCLNTSKSVPNPYYPLTFCVVRIIMFTYCYVNVAQASC